MIHGFVDRGAECVGLLARLPGSNWEAVFFYASMFANQPLGCWEAIEDSFLRLDVHWQGHTSEFVEQPVCFQSPHKLGGVPAVLRS